MAQPCAAPERSNDPAVADRVCLLCGGQDIHRLWEASDQKFRGPGRFIYFKCATCELVFLHPPLSDEALARYYPDHLTIVPPEGEGSRLHRIRQRMKRAVAEDWYGYEPHMHRLPWPLRLLRKALTLPLSPLLNQVPRRRLGGTVLDIGCGSGGFLAFLKTLGWTCYGIEPGLRSRTYAQDVLGLTVHQGTLESCGFPDSFFDVVTLWHVVEHLTNPSAVLREIHRVLKPDGVCVLRTPNIVSWEARCFQGNWYGLDSPRHFFLFSPGTIRAMLEQSGFVVTRLWCQYHPTDFSRSLLYVCEEKGWSYARRVVARWIRYIDLGLVACSPMRRVFGQGGAMHVEARKASS